MKDPFIFISGDGSKTSGLFDVAGDAADGAYLSIVGVPVEDLPSAKTFMDAYKKRWTGSGEELKPFDHCGYEAARIIFTAMEKGATDRAKMIAALCKTDFTGVLGLTRFDEKGDTNKIVCDPRESG